MITDDAGEYHRHILEMEQMDVLVEQYHAEQMERAEAEMAEILGCLANSSEDYPAYGVNFQVNAKTEMVMAEEYLNQIKAILDGGNKPILATILQPLRSAMIDAEFMLEGGLSLIESRDDNV